MKKIWLIIVAVLILSVGAWFYFAQDDTSNSKTDGGVSQTEKISENNDDVPELLIGDPAAPITIVEYGDFQCPICKRFFEQTEPQLLSNYIDTGRAKIVFKVEAHIGEESVLAGEAAYCAAEAGRFKDMHDALYTRQNGINKGLFSLANLKILGQELSLGEDFTQCLDTRRYQSAVLASDDEADARISGTPTFFIGEHKIAGPQPYSVFHTILETQ